MIEEINNALIVWNQLIPLGLAYCSILMVRETTGSHDLLANSCLLAGVQKSPLYSNLVLVPCEVILDRVLQLQCLLHGEDLLKQESHVPYTWLISDL